MRRRRCSGSRSSGPPPRDARRSMRAGRAIERLTAALLLRGSASAPSRLSADRRLDRRRAPDLGCATRSTSPPGSQRDLSARRDRRTRRRRARASAAGARAPLRRRARRRRRRAAQSSACGAARQQHGACCTDFTPDAVGPLRSCRSVSSHRVALLVAARGLVRRRHRAWQVASGSPRSLTTLHVLHGINDGTLASVVVLIAARRAPPRLRPAGRRATGALRSQRARSRR